MLEHPHLDAFSSIFIHPNNFYLKYDAFLVLDITELCLEFNSEHKQKKLVSLLFDILNEALVLAFRKYFFIH